MFTTFTFTMETLECLENSPGVLIETISLGNFKELKSHTNLFCKAGMQRIINIYSSYSNMKALHNATVINRTQKDCLHFAGHNSKHY